MVAAKTDTFHKTSLSGFAPAGESDRSPQLLWDNGKAGYQIGMNRQHILYRTSQKIEHPLGLPGHSYHAWDDWYWDFLKETLRVRGSAPLSGMSQAEYARYRYETRLEGLAARSDDRSWMEWSILHELLDELKG